MTMNSALTTVISVARLSNYLKRLLTSDPSLKDISVRGEVTGARPPSSTSRHLYFSLKDEQAVINCIVWADDLLHIPPLRDGARLVVSGSIDLYPKSGRYQLIVRSARLDGDGALYLALEELRKRLQAEGLFALERKRELPRFPFSVGLISSATAAGANDFRRVCFRRSPHLEIVLIETPVQGIGAGEAVAKAIVHAASGSYDLLVVVRGGGAAEDLWAFNHEAVARAIVASPIPVMTGIGHESDVTLADHAADLHAATPTDAAARLPALDDVRDLLAKLATDIMARSHQLIGRRRERLAGLAQRLERRSPRAQLGRRREQLVNMQLRLSASLVRGRERQREKCVRLGERLARAEPQRLERLRQRLLLAQAKLNGRNPEAILELGYAIVRHEGRALKDVHGVALGVVVEARLAHGTLAARVESVAHDGRETLQSI